jgi:hypothetical protein
MPFFLRVVRWDEYQHYKHRDPPWIKLHRRLLMSETWVSADDASRVLAIACMMLAAGCDNRIPFNADYVKRAAYLNAAPDFSFLLKCGFAEIIDENGNLASNTLAQASTMLAQRREETEHIEQSQSREVSAALPKKAKRQPSARTRLSMTDLPQAWVDYAVELGRDPGSLFQAFTDHHTARGNTMADWYAAWRTWCRNDIRFNGGRRNGPEKSSSAERGRDLAKHLFEIGAKAATGKP